MGKPHRPNGADPDTETALTTTSRQRLGGITGKGFLPGQSGNPAGPAVGERLLLQKLGGKRGEAFYEHLLKIRDAGKTATKLKAEIDMFLIERLHGKAKQRIEGGGDGGVLVLNVITNVPAPNDPCA
jgi:hypothetical protein